MECVECRSVPRSATERHAADSWGLRRGQTARIDAVVMPIDRSGARWSRVEGSGGAMWRAPVELREGVRVEPDGQIPWSDVEDSGGARWRSASGRAVPARRSTGWALRAPSPCWMSVDDVPRGPGRTPEADLSLHASSRPGHEDRAGVVRHCSSRRLSHRSSMRCMKGALPLLLLRLVLPLLAAGVTDPSLETTPTGPLCLDGCAKA